MKCHACGNENPSNARFCGSCRQPLDDGAVPEPVINATDDQKPVGRSGGTLTWSIAQWVWGAILILGGVTQLSDEVGAGGLLVIVGGLLAAYGGVLMFQNKKLWTITSGKAAILLNVIGFVLFFVGIPA